MGSRRFWRLTERLTRKGDEVQRSSAEVLREAAAPTAARSGGQKRITQVDRQDEKGQIIAEDELELV